MSSVLNCQTYQQGIVNLNSMLKFYTAQDELNNLRIMKLSSTEPPPDVRNQMLCNRLKRNWPLIANEFLPRNTKGLAALKVQTKNTQRNNLIASESKIRLAQLAPIIHLLKSSPATGNTTPTMRFLGGTYTLPQDRSTDVPETLPPRDSPMVNSGLPQRTPFNRDLRFVFSRIDLQNCLRSVLSSLQRFVVFLLNTGPVQHIGVIFVANIFEHGRSVTNIRRVLLVEPFALMWQRILNAYATIRPERTLPMNQEITRATETDDPQPADNPVQLPTPTGLSTAMFPFRPGSPMPIDRTLKQVLLYGVV